MLFAISFIFIFIVMGQFEAGIITTGQAIIYATYGLLMTYHTSKPYWTENQEKNKNNRRK